MLPQVLLKLSCPQSRLPAVLGCTYYAVVAWIWSLIWHMGLDPLKVRWLYLAVPHVPHVETLLHCRPAGTHVLVEAIID
jgi:hypothetical protein